jgi:hypothetical protein
MADSEQPTLASLSAKISELSGALSKFYEQQNLPLVSFAADSPSRYNELSPEMFMVRQNLLDALNDMTYLAQGPADSIFNYAHSVIVLSKQVARSDTNIIGRRFLMPRRSTHSTPLTFGRPYRWTAPRRMKRFQLTSHSPEVSFIVWFSMA